MPDLFEVERNKLDTDEKRFFNPQGILLVKIKQLFSIHLQFKIFKIKFYRSMVLLYLMLFKRMQYL